MRWYIERMGNGQLRGKRQLHVWLKCEAYAKLQNLASQRGCTISDVIARLVEQETAGVEITVEQAEEIKKRVEGRPFLELAKKIGNKIMEYHLPLRRPRRY